MCVPSFSPSVSVARAFLLNVVMTTKEEEETENEEDTRDDNNGNNNHKAVNGIPTRKKTGIKVLMHSHILKTGEMHGTRIKHDSHRAVKQTPNTKQTRIFP